MPHCESIQNGEVTIGAIATRLGVSIWNVKDAMREWRTERGIAPRTIKKNTTNATFEVIGGIESIHEDFNVVEAWERKAKATRDMLERGFKEPIRIKIKESKPIAIGAISDEHIGGVCEYDAMKETARIVKETEGFFSIHAGDGMDNHIKIFSAVLASDMKPSKQLALYEHYLSMFGEESILCLLSGNHDLWTKKVAGIDCIKALAASKKILYHPEELRLIIELGDQEYRFLVRHKARFNSVFNKAHSHAQNWRLGDWNFDVAIFAHTHSHVCSSFDGHGLPRWAMRPASFQVYSSYAEEEGFHGTRDVRCPAVILYPDRREIEGIQTIGKAARWLEVERSLY